MGFTGARAAAAALCALLLSHEVSAFWETDFVKNSKSMPSIEIKLAPPEDVEAEVKLLEANRAELEEGMMMRLEQEFNSALLDSRDKIKGLVHDVGCADAQSLSVFDDKELVTELLAKFAHAAPRRADAAVSFLQVDEEFVPSSVRVMVGRAQPQMTDVDPPDPAIKEKMEQIEQARNDEAIHAFYQESQEFAQLTQVTLVGRPRARAELQKNLQLQLNPYLLETAKIKDALRHRLKSGHAAPGQVSFLQTASAYAPETRQLNVKIGQSDEPYPTVDDYVMNMEKRRDVAEKAVGALYAQARNKVLGMYLSLMKVARVHVQAQHEMIADELHAAVSRVISQYSGIVEEANRGAFNKKVDKTAPKNEG